MADFETAAWMKIGALGTDLGSNLLREGVDALSQNIKLRDDEIDGPTFCLCIVCER
jgi:hypothetical protein